MPDPAPQQPTARLRADALAEFAAALLHRLGLDAEMAHDVGAVLVEGDLLGRSAHGLRLLAPWLADLGAGRAALAGAPRVFNQRAAAALWDGQHLPGPWLVRRAIGWCAPRAVQYGCAGIVIRRSHRIGCPLAYLEPVARAGLLIRIACHEPRAAGASAGLQGADAAGAATATACGSVGIGMPTSAEPLLVELPGSDAPDAAATSGGHASTDAARAWALAVAASTLGLAGWTGIEPPAGAGATVSIQIHDPAAFGGLEAFGQEVVRAAEAGRIGAPRLAGPHDPAWAGPLPGSGPLACKRRQLAEGVALDGEVLGALSSWARRLDVPLPDGAAGAGPTIG